MKRGVYFRGYITSNGRMILSPCFYLSVFLVFFLCFSVCSVFQECWIRKTVEGRAVFDVDN